MTAWTSQQAGNWTRASNEADSPWYDGGAQSALSSYPGGAGAGDTVTIAAHAVTLDANPANSIATITDSGNDGYITVATDRTLMLTGNPAISSSTTSTSGFIRVATNTLTIVHDQGAGTVTVLQSASGRAILTSSGGGLIASNSGGTVMSGSAGTCLRHDSTGTYSVTGLVTASGECICIEHRGGTGTIAGNAVSSGQSGRALVMVGGTCTLNGIPLYTGAGMPRYGTVSTTAGTFIWTGARTVSAGETCAMSFTSMTVTNFTDLALANAGKVLLYLAGATLTLTRATFTNTTATAEMLELAGGKITIIGPTIPAEEDVETGVEYGYSGDLQTGTLAAGGGAPVFGGNIARRV